MLNAGILETPIFRAFKTGMILKKPIVVAVFASLNGTHVKADLMISFWVPFSISVYDHNRLFHIAAVGEQGSSYYFFDQVFA